MAVRLLGSLPVLSLACFIARAHSKAPPSPDEVLEKLNEKMMEHLNMDELMAGLSSHLSEKFGQETGDVFAPSDGADAKPRKVRSRDEIKQELVEFYDRYGIGYETEKIDKALDKYYPNSLQKMWSKLWKKYDMEIKRGPVNLKQKSDLDFTSMKGPTGDAARAFHAQGKASREQMQKDLSKKASEAMEEKIKQAKDSIDPLPPKMRAAHKRMEEAKAAARAESEEDDEGPRFADEKVEEVIEVKEESEDDGSDEDEKPDKRHQEL